MRVLVVAEGVHELGSDTGDPADRRGALLALLEQLLPPPLDWETLPVRSKKLDLELQPGKGSGFYKRGLAVLRFARKHGFDGAVMLVDEDGDTSRHRSFDQAQEFTVFAIPRAFGIAVRTFDAWMIADEKALSTVLQRTVQRRPNPEKEKTPKDVAAQLLADSPQVNMSQRQLYAQLAACLNLLLLRERCPKGFVPFADRVVTLRQGPT